jgi:hypothetical protein
LNRRAVADVALFVDVPGDICSDHRYLVLGQPLGNSEADAATGPCH